MVSLFNQNNIDFCPVQQHFLHNNHGYDTYYYHTSWNCCVFNCL